MSNVEAEAAALRNALDDDLWAILEDFNAPDAVRAAADAILREHLHDKLLAAIKDFEAGSMRLLELVDTLSAAVARMGQKPGLGALGHLPELLGRASELHRRFHDAEGMRKAHTSAEEAAEVLADEAMLPPGPPPAERPRPLTAAASSGGVLRAPVPRNSKRYEELADEYVAFFVGADFASAEAERTVAGFAAKALDYRERYEKVAEPLGIPWWFVAGVHMLESSFNFATHLHNGDPLTKRTSRVPAGRPKSGSPPFSWEESAQDALSRLDLDKQKDWSLPRALFRWERYNGFGYRRHRVPTPYLWSLSTIYQRGKYVADGVFSASAVSKQCGAATLLKYLHQKGHVVLHLDRVGEDEDALAPQFQEEAVTAAAAGTVVVDAAVPDNGAFEAFLRSALPGLRHFKPAEFLMMGGAHAKNGLNAEPPRELWPNVVDLARVLDELRERIGHPIVLHSVYRSEAYNKAVGGEPGSQHRLFRAADFTVLGHGNPRSWAEVLREMRSAKLFQGGIGVYSTFVHVDTRGWNANW